MIKRICKDRAYDHVMLKAPVIVWAPELNRFLFEYYTWGLIIVAHSFGWITNLISYNEDNSPTKECTGDVSIIVTENGIG